MESDFLNALAQNMYGQNQNPSGLGFSQDSPSLLRGQGELNQWGQPKQMFQGGSQREVWGQERNVPVEKYLRNVSLEETGDPRQWRDFRGWDATENNPEEDQLYNPKTPWQGFDPNYGGRGGSPNVGMRGLGNQSGQLMQRAMSKFGNMF